MNPIALTWAYLRARPGLTALNLVLTSLAVAMVVVALHVDRQTEARLQKDARGIDLVLGAKGSPLQIVLATVYHLDVPPGNIKLNDAHDILGDPRVRQGIPLALGDSYRGARIVGTAHALVQHYGGELAAGRLWDAPMQAVLGAELAARSGLGVGSSFVGTHGLAAGGADHGDHPYRVAGVLKATGTVLDRLILTDLESVWEVHGHKHDAAAGSVPTATGTVEPQVHDEHPDGEREITAMLLQYATPLAAASLPREINAKPGLVAASPAYETGRLMALVGGAANALSVLALTLVALAAMSIFVAINVSLAARAYDLALMRLLGATRVRLLVLTLLEGVTLALAGVILGLGFGHMVLAVLAAKVDRASHMAITAWAWHPWQWGLLAVVPLLGLLAALWPAIKAARADVAVALARSA